MSYCSCGRKEREISLTANSPGLVSGLGLCHWRRQVTLSSRLHNRQQHKTSQHLLGPLVMGWGPDTTLSQRGHGAPPAGATKWRGSGLGTSQPPASPHASPCWAQAAARWASSFGLRACGDWHAVHGDQTATRSPGMCPVGASALLSMSVRSL